MCVGKTIEHTLYEGNTRSSAAVFWPSGLGTETVCSFCVQNCTASSPHATSPWPKLNDTSLQVSDRPVISEQLAVVWISLTKWLRPYACNNSQSADGIVSKLDTAKLH